MWLVSTLLCDYWFESLNQAYDWWQASPTSRTFPVLDSEWPKKARTFQEIVKDGANAS